MCTAIIQGGHLRTRTQLALGTQARSLALGSSRLHPSVSSHPPQPWSPQQFHGVLAGAVCSGGHPVLPGEQCSVIGPCGSRPSRGQGPEHHRRLAGGDRAALGVPPLSVGHATLTAFAFEHACCARPPGPAPSTGGAHVQVGGSGTRVWRAQCGRERFQQLTSVTFSDFRISRKSPEETVGLLQRKGKASRFFAASSINLISRQTCHPMPHLKAEGHWVTSVLWPLGPWYSACQPGCCWGPAMFTGPALSRSLVLTRGVPQTQGHLMNSYSHCSGWSLNKEARNACHFPYKHPPPSIFKLKKDNEASLRTDSHQSFGSASN